MTNVLQFTNPFDIKAEDVVRSTIDDGFTLRQIMENLWPGWQGFEYPTIIMVNDEPWLIARWDDVVPDHASVSFIRLAEGVEAIIIAVVVLVVVAVALVLLVPKQNPAAVGAADVAGQQKNGDTVYSLSGEKNQNRLNSSIECAYGRNRLWPSYAAVPYNTYDGNQQIQYSLFCLGHGTYSISKMQFEDTPIQSFDDVEFEIVNPNERFDLFADNVVTSSAVSNIELFGTNEKEFSGPTGAYVANGPFTACNQIQVDVSFPSGLYKLGVDNDLESEEVSVSFQYQKINDEGKASGAWTPLTFTKRTIEFTVPGEGGEMKTIYKTSTVPYFYKKLATNTPQRFTLSANVALGRYQVRAQRTNPKNNSTNSQSVVRWETLRAIFPSVRKYGDVTLVAIKARASNNLNNNAAQRFNVMATRKLPTWNPLTGWGALKATRNPVWALCDVFLAKYGGRLPDTFLDLPELYELSVRYETSKHFFDYIFDQSSTVWEAARSIARAGRGIPMLNGSQITIIQDRQRLAATAVFNQHNIVADSFEWTVKLVNVQDHDGIEIQYMDEDTFEPETVLCLIGEQDYGDNPQLVKLPGVSSRSQAYHEGLYQRAVELFARENIQFKTGLEGHLPRYGDLILVSHDVPKWGTGGMVKSIDGATIVLSDPVTFLPGVNHKMILRKKNGAAYGPLSVVPGEDAYTVTVSPPVDMDQFYFDDIHERPYYLFGEENFEAKRCTVVGLQPESEDQVTVKCIVYDDRIYSYEAAPTPGKYAPPTRVVEPARPIVTSLQVARVPGTFEFVQVSWPPALGARTYLLDESTDQVHWQRVTTLPSTVYEMRVKKGKLYLRVAGVGVDIGPWVYWQGTVGNITLRPLTVTGLMLKTFAPATATIKWNDLATEDSYDVNVYEKATGRWLRFESIVGTEYTYTLDKGDVDGLLLREVLFRVKGRNIVGVSEDAAVLTVTMLERLKPIISITTDAALPLTDAGNVTTDHS